MRKALTWGLVALGCGLTACSGEVESKVVVTPPKPAPSVAPSPGAEPVAKAEPSTPADPDGDGVTGAADRCPDKPETKNGFDDADGCPDEVPLAYLDGDTMVLGEQVSFAPGGKLAASSHGLLDAMAKALQKDAGSKVEIGVFYAGGTKSPADGTATRTRAGEVRSALTKRGVSGGRLSTKSYERCPERQGTRKGTVMVVLRVVERGGKKTGVKLGCDA